MLTAALHTHTRCLLYMQPQGAMCFGDIRHTAGGHAIMSA